MVVEDDDIKPEKVWMFCPNCTEEYDLPEDMEQCPICGKKELTIL